LAVERFPVEAGHILLFARAIGDPNPAYRGAAVAGSDDSGPVYAPPTFAQASAQFDEEYGLRWSPDRPWHGSGKEPTSLPRPAEGSGGGGGGGRAPGQVGLHAEQHFEYHRPLVAGDVLTATVRQGESWEKEGRSGHLKFQEIITEYRDEQGELVVTGVAVGVSMPAPKKADD
jgi:hypothetical protein